MNNKTILSKLLVAGLIGSLLAGCGRTNNDSLEKETTSQNENDLTTEQISLPEVSSEAVEQETEAYWDEDAEAYKIQDQLSEIQLNSVGMLNYLTVLTKEINSSKNSRVYLEEAYSGLLNNTYPNAVDERTQTEIEELLDTLEDYRMLTVKRERLKYIYDQNLAQAMKAAIPNPIGLLSAVNSKNLASIVTSVVYMAVDSYTSYTTYTNELDMKYLQDGWALDDEEAKTLHESRKATFSYMLDMVRDYNIPGDMTLYEAAVDNFVKWSNESNTVQRITYLEDNRDTYQAYGGYWLTMAKSYYENAQYNDCIEAISQYEAIQPRIFRKDTELAKTLPYAIAAAGESLSGDEYVETISHYADLIIENTSKDDWRLRYIAAQTYIDLAGQTGNNEYLKKAYDIVLNNVNVLVGPQLEENQRYLSPVQEEPYPSGDSPDKKESKKTKEELEIDAYNKQLYTVRKIELPPISEPLLLNVNLLIALADELDVSDAERTKLDNIIHNKGENIFLCNTLDDVFWFCEHERDEEEKEPVVEMSSDTIQFPARYLTDEAEISVTVKTKDGVETSFDDWKIKNVDRGNDKDLTSFVATYTSEKADDYEYADGDVVTCTILPKDGYELPTYTYSFDVEVHTGMPDFWYTYVNFTQQK